MANEMIIQNGVLTNVIKDEAGVNAISYSSDPLGNGNPGWVSDAGNFAVIASGGLPVAMASFDQGGNPAGAIAIVSGGPVVFLQAFNDSGTDYATIQLGGNGYVGRARILDPSDDDKIALSIDTNGGRVSLKNSEGTPDEAFMYVDSSGNLAFNDGVTGLKTLAQLAAVVGDDLGNHTATTDLQMSGNSIYGDSSTGGEFVIFANSIDLGSNPIGGVKVAADHVGIAHFNSTPGINSHLKVDASGVIVSLGGDGPSDWKMKVTTAGQLDLTDDGTNIGTFDSTSLTGSFSYTLPNLSGTLALTSQLSNYLPLAGGTMSGNITMSDDGWIGLGGSAGRIVFDVTASPDTITIQDAALVANGITIGAAANAITSAAGIVIQAASTLQLRGLGGQVTCQGAFNPAAQPQDIGALTAGGAWRNIVLDRATGGVKFYDGTDTLTLSSAALTGTRVATLPNYTGTVCVYETGTETASDVMTWDGSKWTASAPSVGHTQNTDTGTTSPTWIINSGGNSATLQTSALGGNRIFTLPDAAGTIALTSDIIDPSGVYLPLAGGAMTGDISMGGNQLFGNTGGGGILTVANDGDDYTTGTDYSMLYLAQGYGQIHVSNSANGNLSFAVRADLNAFEFYGVGAALIARISRTGNLTLSNGTGVGTFNMSGITGSPFWQLPSTSGTFALTSALSSYLPLSGGTMTGNIIMGGNFLYGGTGNDMEYRADGGRSHQFKAGGVTRLFVYDNMVKLGSSSPLDCNSNAITNAASLNTHTIPGGTGTLALAENVLSLAGGTMTGDIAMGSNDISGLGTLNGYDLQSGVTNGRIAVFNNASNPATINTYMRWNTVNGEFELADVTPAHGSATIDQHGDVDTTTDAPVTGEVLEWNGSNWVPSNGGKLPLSGGTMSGTINMNNNQFTNVSTIGFQGNPDFNLTTGSTLDINVNGTPEFTFGATELDMHSNNITNLGTLNTHTVPGGTGTLALTSQLSSYLPLAGGTLTGSLTLDASTIIFDTGALNGILQSDTITSTQKTWTLPNNTGTIALTSDLGSYLPVAGGTMSGPIAMGGNNITGLGFLYWAASTGELRIDAAQKYQFKVGGSSRFEISSTGELWISDDGTNFAKFSSSLLTGSRTYSLPDVGGTVALLTSITYENLNTNGDVGTGAGQLAIGNHTHTGVYEPADSAIMKETENANLLGSGAAANGTVLTANGSGGTAWVAPAAAGDFKADGSVPMTANIELDNGSKIGDILATGLTGSNNVIDTIDTTLFDGAVWQYTLKRTDSAGNLRTGTLRAVWNGTGTSTLDETSTSDIGSTSAVTFDMAAGGGNNITLRLQSSGGTWQIKLFRVWL